MSSKNGKMRLRISSGVCARQAGICGVNLNCDAEAANRKLARLIGVKPSRKSSLEPASDQKSRSNLSSNAGELDSYGIQYRFP